MANERFLEQWTKMRAMGRARYVLVSGVLAWGVPMFLVMTFMVNHERKPDMIAVSAVLWLFGGGCYGWVTWLLSERKFRKLATAAEASRET